MDKNWSSRKIFLIPALLGLLLAFTLTGVLSSLFSKQINDYKTNIKMFIELWEREGMPKIGLNKSINIVQMIKTIVSRSANNVIFHFIAYFAVSVFAHNATWKDIDIAEVIEIGAILFVNVESKIRFLPGVLMSDFILAVFMISSFTCLYFLTRKIMHWKLQLYFGSLLIILFLQFGMVFLTDLKGIIRPTDVSIEEYKGEDVSDDLKRRVIKAGTDAGIKKENIYIRKTPIVNAFATSGPRFKYIVIFTGILKLMNDDQVMAVMHHEVGHVTNNHVIKGMLFEFVFSITVIVALFFVYKKTAQYCNGFAAWCLTELLVVLFMCLFAYIYNGACSRKYEREADYASYSRKGVATPFCESMKALGVSDEGTIFEFTEEWLGLIATHPPLYKRILAGRKHLASKGE